LTSGPVASLDFARDRQFPPEADQPLAGVREIHILKASNKKYLLRACSFPLVPLSGTAEDLRQFPTSQIAFIF